MKGNKRGIPCYSGCTSSTSISSQKGLKNKNTESTIETVFSK